VGGARVGQAVNEIELSCLAEAPAEAVERGDRLVSDLARYRHDLDSCLRKHVVNGRFRFERTDAEHRRKPHGGFEQDMVGRESHCCVFDLGGEFACLELARQYGRRQLRCRRTSVVLPQDIDLILGHASRLGEIAFPGEFWMNLQAYYDLKMARRSLKPEDVERIKAQRAA
jgi:hypothetical protein